MVGGCRSTGRPSPSEEAMSTQTERAERFRALHDRSKLLLLPNAWDAGSARVFEDLGFDAIATTSAGVAWSLGYADGECAPLAEVAAAVRRIVRVTSVPVSVDFESGYGDSPAGVAAAVREIIDAGAVGINLEDGIRHESLRDADDAARRIAAARDAAREAGAPIVINARVDVWIVGFGAGDEERLDETLRRARTYLEAGADCIYPMALADAGVIRRLCSALDAPVNVGAHASLPGVAELARLGVARISTATRLAALALSCAREAALRLRDDGRFDHLDAAFAYPDLQRLFARF